MKITGKFTPDLKSAPFYKEADGCGRMTIDKTYEGDLLGAGTGEMLSSMGTPEGNAGYVAIEHFTGSLDGKKGSFSLMHYGRMDEGKDSLKIEVVSGSGTDELKGISGVMSIDVDDDGGHRYGFDYTLS